MTGDPENRRPEAQREVEKTCPRCDLYTPTSESCAAVTFAGRFARIFEVGRCDPRRFLLGFVRRYLARKHGRREKAEAEDVVSRVVLDLLERPPRPPLPSPDLIGLRRCLAARAVQRVVDQARQRTGRVRCGGCLHHRELSDGSRRCHHSGESHYWGGREVPASEDPRSFDPPCHEFTSRRASHSLSAEVVERLPSPEHGPLANALKNQSVSVLLEALEAIRERDARVALTLHLSFFKSLPNREIADKLGTVVRSVTRYKARGLEWIREELSRRGVERLEDLEWRAA